MAASLFVRPPTMGCGSTKVAPARFSVLDTADAPTLFLQLPDDICQYIFDFTGTRTLSYVCHKMWLLLQQRRLVCHSSSPTGLMKLLDLGGRTHSLTVYCREISPVGPGVVPFYILSNLLSLADLQLHLRYDGAVAVAAETTATAAGAPTTATMETAMVAPTATTTTTTTTTVSPAAATSTLASVLLSVRPGGVRAKKGF